MALAQPHTFSPDPAHLLQVASPSNRDRVRHFIQCCFAQEYAADIDVYSRHLLALIDDEQRVQAAVGYQSAAEGPLFLEQYLTQPVETCLALHTSRTVTREGILEVGNLASRSSGWTRYLILSLAGFLHEQGFEWLVITATPQVLNSFHKLGVGAALIPLTAADPARLQEDPQRWGRYYDEKPLVMAANIRLGQARLRRHQSAVPMGFGALPDQNLTIAG